MRLEVGSSGLGLGEPVVARPIDGGLLAGAAWPGVELLVLDGHDRRGKLGWSECSSGCVVMSWRIFALNMVETAYPQ